jgi:hypothetical protein
MTKFCQAMIKVEENKWKVILYMDY